MTDGKWEPMLELATTRQLMEELHGRFHLKHADVPGAKFVCMTLSEMMKTMTPESLDYRMAETP